MDDTPNHLLGIWAHPDDEAYLSAGMMARAIDAGGSVTLLTVTDGECGFGHEDTRAPSTRAEQRREELERAMAQIGVTDIRTLGIPDGHVGTVPADPLVRSIKSVIKEIRPDAVLTFGPDGITGHKDHVANSVLVTRAWSEAPSGDLLYAAKTEAWLDEWRDLHSEFDVWMTDEPTGVCAEDVELVIDLDESELDRKRAVLAEHRSQTASLSEAFGEDRYRRWIREEAFRRPTSIELQGFV
jgi:LmbE family N-acetylglucosaminyl deacetylase